MDHRPPIRPEPVQTMPHAVEHEAAKQRHVGSGALRVLVVHTDAVFRSTTVDALTRSGHTVRTAADSGTAVGLARSWKPDVVVMGFVPRLDRFTAQRVAAQRAAHPIPVVVVGDVPDDDRYAMRAVGARCVRALSSEQLASIG